MTPEQIEYLASLREAGGHTTMPVPLSEWRVAQMSKAGQKTIEGMADAVAYAKIDALWKRTKVPKNSSDVTLYDWGYKDGIDAAKALFATESVVPTKSIGRVDQKALAKGKVKPVSTMPKHFKVAAKAKADRVEKRLRANRKGKA